MKPFCFKQGLLIAVCALTPVQADFLRKLAADCGSITQGGQCKKTAGCDWDAGQCYPSTPSTSPPTSASTTAPPSTDAPTKPPTSGSTGGSPSDVKITELMYNPSSCSDSTGEWLEVYNSGLGEVDITGWTIEDAVNSPVAINSFILPSGGYFIMARTTDGCGGLNADQTGLPPLNNSGEETVTLKDASGSTIDVVVYSGGSAASPDFTIERKADANGQPIDTDDSAADFQESSSAGGTPRAGYASPGTAAPTVSPAPTATPTTASPVATPSNTNVKFLSYNVEFGGSNAAWQDVVKAENADIAVFIEVGT